MAKKKKKPQKSNKRSALYTISGSKLERKNKFCPKCGAGVFMANHKDRITCGSCFYSEFKSKEAPKKE